MQLNNLNQFIYSWYQLYARAAKLRSGKEIVGVDKC